MTEREEEQKSKEEELDELMKAKVEAEREY